ncbi:hypothetical protein [Plantactinospora endophytica]|uniref:DUF4178 domain-containing protein n=1 Tax=Plantactinospora endophytica TaxID=673535 RepID=A0ABQ4DZ52_9ACTN|nr:hypothetical protein [Plantactinospora endophytica]GIG87346.1 hypothetical protein Pen02_22820 [Plantactinospora endophytica]
MAVGGNGSSGQRGNGSSTQRGNGGRAQRGNAPRAAAERATAAKGTARRLKIILGVVLSLVFAGFIVFGALMPDDESTLVPPPTPAERTDTVTLLQRAHSTQQVCYGWRLRTGGAAFDTTPVSVGSNLGDSVAVDSDPARCPRWVEVDAVVWYTSASSESSDSASYRVSSSPDLAQIDFDRGLARLGVDADQFVDDPGWAVCQAAVLLPLLVSETGAGSATRAPVAPAAGAAPPELPDPGNDFWRNRWPLLLGAVGVLLLTVLFLAIGRYERRHQRPEPVGSGTGPTGDAVGVPEKGGRSR